MERVPEMKLHDNLARLELSGESAQGCFVVVRRSADRKLDAELLGQSTLQSNNCLITDLVLMRQEAVGFAKLILRQSLHPDQETALLPSSARPFFNQTVDGFPTAKIEVTHAEVRTLRDFECFPQGRQEVEGDVVEDSRHGGLVV